MLQVWLQVWPAALLLADWIQAQHSLQQGADANLPCGVPESFMRTSDDRDLTRASPGCLKCQCPCIPLHRDAHTIKITHISHPAVCWERPSSAPCTHNAVVLFRPGCVFQSMGLWSSPWVSQKLLLRTDEPQATVASASRQTASCVSLAHAPILQHVRHICHLTHTPSCREHAEGISQPASSAMDPPCCRNGLTPASQCRSAHTTR